VPSRCAFLKFRIFHSSPEAVKKLNRAILAHHGSESTAENARGAHVPPGGAGAPAHAFRRKDLTFNFFPASLLQTGLLGSDVHERCTGRAVQVARTTAL
jgi:hypothetical protein